jgi:serine protease Do
MRLRLFALLPALLIAASQAHAMPESFAPIVEPSLKAVVNISTTQKIDARKAMPFGFNIPDSDPRAEEFRDFLEQFQEQFGGGMPQQNSEVTSLGSGFVVDPSGLIVTNNHVIADADKISVTFHDNTKRDATIVGRDPKTDLALLRVKSPRPLPYVSFGDSDALKVGDWVIAVGNPFGLGGSVSAGIVSARGRNINIGPFDDFIQTDAAINRGNSGGPLFNASGKVVGINSAIFSPTGGNVGIGFAVPAALAQPILDQLREKGRAQRAWLGVKIQEVSDEIADSIGLKPARGALVLDVSSDGPAHGSGIQSGDIVVRFDGKDVKEMRNLPRLVAETPIGKRVEVVVWRNGKEIPFRITLGELPEESAGSAPSDRRELPQGSTRGEQFMGMDITPLTRELRQQYRIDRTAEGLLVRAVESTSEAMKAGLMRGDVIAEANQKNVESLASLKAEIAAAKKLGRQHLLLRVLRGSEVLFVTLPVE